MARKKITLEQVMEAVEKDNCHGFCLACGADAYGVEPEAQRYGSARRSRIEGSN